MLFENFFKVLEIAGLLALASIDIVITGSVWGLLINADFEFLGVTIPSSVTGGLIALAFWYAGFFIVNWIGDLMKNGEGDISTRLKKAFKNEMVVIGLVCAAILYVIDMLGDSLAGVIMVFPDVTVFNLFERLDGGPIAMYFMMFVIMVLTMVGEPIIYVRMLMWALEEKRPKGKQYGMGFGD